MDGSCSPDDRALMNAASAPPAPANTEPHHVVRRSELPLSCPTPSMALWNSHPRVYLPLDANDGQATCPYCGTRFVLVD